MMTDKELWVGVLVALAIILGIFGYNGEAKADISVTNPSKDCNHRIRVLQWLAQSNMNLTVTLTNATGTFLEAWRRDDGLWFLTMTPGQQQTVTCVVASGDKSSGKPEMSE